MLELAVFERVDAGVAWLDERVPDRWRRINLANPDLSSDYSCVLGQSYGRFWRALDEQLGGDLRRAGALGFTIDDTNGDDDAPADEEYTSLEAEWRRRIAERRAEARCG